MHMQKITLRRIFHYYWIHAKKYPKSGVAVFVLYALGSILGNTLMPLMYKRVLDIMSGSADMPASASQELLSLFVFIIAIVIAYNAVFRSADYAITYFQSHILKELADDVFVRFHKHSYSFFADNFSGALVTKAKRYVNSFETIHDRITYSFVFRGITISGALIVMFFVVPIIGAFYLVWIILFGLLIAWFIQKKIPYDLLEAEADSKVTARIADTITNVLAIKMFASRKRETQDFFRVTHDEEKKRHKAWNLHNLQMLIQGVLFGILEITIFGMALWLWTQGEITIGTVVLVQVYVIGTFTAVWDFGNALKDIVKATSDASEAVAIFEEKPSVRDIAHPEKCRIQNGEIEFQKVAFKYENKQQYILSDFSLRIKPGEKIGLVGHSGAGKTTITKILLRFSDISGGKVLIDGQDIRKIKQDDLRRNISYVPQEPMLFHRSLKENIAYGKPNASMKEIVAVAKKAHAHEFIEKLPKGYNTLVGERGVKLSGGERQRVAIARAMLKNAPILILDEATSSLDSVSERHIQEALDELMKGRTTIVVAHRLSTIQKMDRIIVIEDGDIVEEGKHEELLALKSVYANFWQQQSGAFLQE